MQHWFSPVGMKPELNEKITITGIGTVNTSGTGLAALASTLREGRLKPIEIDQTEGYHRKGSSKLAYLVKNVDLSDWISPHIARRMSLPSRYAVAAAKMAYSNARLRIPEVRDSSVSVALSNAFGPLGNTQKILDQIQVGGPSTVSPSLFTECVANAPAANVAIQCKVSGPNHTISEREAGPLLAVCQGLEDIQAGKANRSLVGSVEELTPLSHSILDIFGALARGKNGLEEKARPFDLKRNGFMAAEGATVLILEKESSAKSRNTKIFSRIVGWGRAFDPSSSRVSWGKGVTALETGLRQCFHRFKINFSEIDLIISGASGSISGDRLEAWVLKKAWKGKKLPPILTPKGITGEYGGAFLGAAVLAASGNPMIPFPSFENLDPELNILPHDGSRLEKIHKTLITSLGSSGTGSWLILEQP